MPLLAAIADPARPPLDGRRMAVVVAHPDDETLGAGALLPRLAGITVAVVTDGAPRRGFDAARLGFGSPADYAAARAAELDAALAVANVPAEAAERLGVPDQEAVFQIAGIARSLAALFADRGIEIVFTHAFEGGHPDHDATAMAVALAARCVPEQPAVIEMPLYHLGPAGMVAQTFCDGEEGTVVALTLEEQRRKRGMVACHVSQAATLAPFALDIERFRHAPEHDFAAVPNNGRALYAGHDWGLDPARWPALAVAAERALGLGEAAWA